MKKQIVSMILVAAMASSLIACGSNTGTTSNTSESTSEAATSEAAASETAASETSDAADTAWPEKTINIIVPFSAGGDTDFNARTMGEYLSKELGQTVVVTNVTGSGGSIAANQVKDSDNDGYTILCDHAALNMNAVTGVIDWNYSDLTMGCIFAMGLGEAVIVRADSQWDSLEDLVKDGAANPGKYNCAATTGGTTMWAPIALNKAGASLNVVDGGGASDRIVSLLGGHCDIIINSLSSVKDYIASGEFKVLATCTAERSEEYPDVPTMAELGYDCSYGMDYTFFFPADTDPAIAAKLADAVQKVNQDEEYQKAIYEAYQQQPIEYSVDDSAAYWSDEYTRLMDMQSYFTGQ